MDLEHPREEFEEPAKPGKEQRMTTNKVRGPNEAFSSQVTGRRILTPTPAW